MSANVSVLGCVNKMGNIILERYLTVGAAIRAAGGFRFDFDNDFAPTGVVTVRTKRKHDGKYYCRRRLNYKNAPQQARSFLLGDGDQIVVQYGFGKNWPNLHQGGLSKRWKNG